MPQKLHVKNFKWVKYISKFDENFIKSYNDESTEKYFLEDNMQDPEYLNNLHND